jgi:plastocyanin
MGTGIGSRARLLLLGATLLTILAAAASTAATKYVVKFGGTLGSAYSPNFLSISVGDTIQWQGDFSTHPLSSATIPEAAPSWHNATGSVFDYVVIVAGTYEYQCDVHGGDGMVGSFVAIVTGVDNKQTVGQPAFFGLEQNSPNPFNPSTTIRFELPHASNVSLTVYNLLGQEVATLVNEEKSAGIFDVQFNATTLASGVYVYRMQAGSFVETKKLILIR